MFDVLLNELAKRLNLGDRAGGLLGMLLSVIFDEKRGGFAGFIDRFRGAGLNDAVTSWLGNGENRSLSPSQLESTLGGALLSQMS
jgi:OmpA-OmpF porin, OOP family